MILLAAEAKCQRHPGCSRCRRLKAAIDRSGMLRYLCHRREDIKILRNLPVGCHIARAWLSRRNSTLASRVCHIRHVPGIVILNLAGSATRPDSLKRPFVSPIIWCLLLSGRIPFMLAGPLYEGFWLPGTGMALLLLRFGSRPMIETISGL